MKMSIVIAMAVIFGFFLMPQMIYAQSGQTEATSPPVAQPLVREGDFATELVTELNLGTAQNEAEAESMLTAAGIAPRNGWISDYPVTPDIVAELQQAIGEAAEANRLPLAKDAALNALQKVETSFDMAVVPDTSGQYAESPPSTDTYTDSSVVDNYYSEEGPPVVTYYPPPPDYGYLYAWVPSPFWCGGFFFPGFFVLNDFNVVVTGDHHGHHQYGHHDYHGGGVISNHVRDPHTGTIARIDPVTRTERTFRSGSGPTGGFATSEARRGASAISGRSIERAPMHNAGSPPMSGRTGGGTPGRNSISPGNERERVYQSPPTARPAHPGNFSGREFSQPRMSGRSFSSPPPTRGFNSDGFHGFAHGGSLGGFHGGGSIRGFHGGPSFGGFHGGGGMRH